MAIFRNKEGDLPPLIPTAGEGAPTIQQEQSVPAPGTLPDLAQPVGLPDLPEHPAQPTVVQESGPQPIQMPDLSPVATPTPVEARPQPAPLPQEAAPQPLPDAGPQFDQQIEQVKRPESVDGIQQEQVPAKKEDESKLQRRRRKKQQDDQQAQQQVQQPVAQAPAAKTPERAEIEKILSDGMSDLYQTMTPQQQEAFRLKGEETATAIEQMVLSLKASTRKVVGLIRDWLQLIPGVNKYFLEQESKLKTDEIVKYQRKVKKERKSRVTL